MPRRPMTAAEPQGPARAARLAAWFRSLDLSGLRHLVGYGIACSGLVVILAGLVPPAAA